MKKEMCEMGFHRNLTFLPSDGYGLWKCDECEEIIDELEMINRGVETACDIVLSFLDGDFNKGNFGFEKLNTIRDGIKKLVEKK